ncbi:MAG: AAA family ATPase, partial [Anaerolineales bacterium]|nr:AAA family ATPase [Anaerolineales bacterium]
MARIIAIAVPKGGTGKTTTTINLGAALAETGERVLLVDFDPQGNLTQALGFSPSSLQTTIYEAIREFTTTFDPNLRPTILPTRFGVDIIPASARLNLANDELATAVRREYVLQKLLEPLAGDYDYILIDTLPYLGVLVLNALVAADEVLVPLQPEYLATESVLLLFNQVEMMRRSRLNPELEVTGILLTMVDERTIIHREAVEHVREHIA